MYRENRVKQSLNFNDEDDDNMNNNLSENFNGVDQDEEESFDIIDGSVKYKQNMVGISYFFSHFSLY